MYKVGYLTVRLITIYKYIIHTVNYIYDCIKCVCMYYNTYVRGVYKFNKIL